MHAFARRRWIRTATGVALALLAVMFCAPAARGSCGHYVLVGAKLAQATAPDVAPPAGGEALPPSVPEEKPRPCSGPSCSRGPAGLPAAPPAARPVSGEQWGCVVTLLALPPSGPVASLADGPSPRPLRLGSGVYHPPR
jgi:hypothetical protein